jgi:hypothetical protein
MSETQLCLHPQVGFSLVVGGRVQYEKKFYKKSERWITSKNSIIALIHHHKLLDLIWKDSLIEE